MEFHKGTNTILVDDEDSYWLTNYRWNVSQGSKNYRRVKVYVLNKGRLLHRLIMAAPDWADVDHINGNPLDNRRINLRLATHSNNQKNMAKHKDNKSGYKGVSWHKRANKWQVHLMNNGHKVYLGLFVNIVEAAKAYNNAALTHFGEFAKLNVISIDISK